MTGRPLPTEFTGMLAECERRFRAHPHRNRVDGTPLANDVPVMMARIALDARREALENAPADPRLDEAVRLLERLDRWLPAWREAIVELEDWCGCEVRLRNMLCAADAIDEISPQTRAFLSPVKDKPSP